MIVRSRKWSLVGVVAVVSGSAVAADPTPADALRLKPRQADVEIELVSESDLANCQVKSVQRDDGLGLIVIGPNGQTLRWFVDTNGDRRPDRWCYFNQGVEVYRDVDSDFDKNADEYRWLGTAGTRWGLDPNQDGEIDSWKSISAEEVTFEIFEAVKNEDFKRFSRLLPSEEEIAGLGLGDEKKSDLKNRVSTAASQFLTMARQQKLIGADSKWSHFGADKPGVVPAGTDGSSSDLTVYENVVALIDTPKGPQQLLIGTLVRVGDGWRVIDLPREVSDGTVVPQGGMFFSASFSDRGAGAGVASGSMSNVFQTLIAKLESVDQALQQATDAQTRADQHSERADVLEQLISAATTDEDRTTWIRQFADTVSAAAQAMEFPDGVNRLALLEKKLDQGATQPLVSYIKFRRINAEYAQQIQAPDAKFADVQEAYLKNLKDYVNEFPEASDSAEALVQIGLSHELAGEVEDAAKWYSQAATRFKSEPWGIKAAGAFERMRLDGRPLSINSTTLDNRRFELASLKGRPVILHFWASWCEPCQADMRVLRTLQAKYAKQKLTIVGINVDSAQASATQFLKANPAYAWIHLREEGGLDGRLPSQLGVLTLPVMIVVDQKGNVVRANVHSAELEGVLDTIVK